MNVLITVALAILELLAKIAKIRYCYNNSSFKVLTYIHNTICSPWTNKVAETSTLPHELLTMQL